MTRPLTGITTYREDASWGHHQAVGDHPGFVGVAHADDGTLEAMEAPGERFLLGVQWHPETVQWHPETQPDHGLFRALAAAAAAWRAQRPVVAAPR